MDAILFFGLAYAYSYSVSRSPGSLMLAYLVAEAPLWWCLLAPLGPGALAFYAIARLAAGLAAAYTLLRRRRYRILPLLGSR